MPTGYFLFLFRELTLFSSANHFLFFSVQLRFFYTFLWLLLFYNAIRTKFRPNSVIVNDVSSSLMVLLSPSGKFGESCSYINPRATRRNRFRLCDCFRTWCSSFRSATSFGISWFIIEAYSENSSHEISPSKTLQINPAKHLWFFTFQIICHHDHNIFKFFFKLFWIFIQNLDIMLSSRFYLYKHY